MHRSISRFWRAGAAALALWTMLFDAAAPLAAAAADVSAAAPTKRSVVLDEADESLVGRRMANVLFYLDTTSAMMFSPKSFQPSVVLADGYDVWGSYGGGVYPENAADWQKTHDTYKYGSDADGAKSVVIDMMKNATFGTGAHPTAALDSDLLNYHMYNSINNTYGRDVDASNNFELKGSTLAEIIDKNRDNYYFPYAYTANGEDALTATYGTAAGLTSLRELYANMNGFVDYHKKAYDGDSSTYTYDYSNIPTGPLPYAMVFKDPKYWQTPPASFTSSDLVPNDSRMYRMKVALWHVLDNAANFDDMRFAMATPFASTNYYFTNDLISSTIKGYPYGTKDSPRLEKDWDKKVLAPYVNGTMDYNATGQSYGLRYTDGSGPVVWSDSEIPMVYPERGTEDEKRRFIAGTRAYLRLPFAEYTHEWTAPGGGKISHLNKFRLWIDGVEDITGANTGGGDTLPDPKGHYVYPNPELRPNGLNAHSWSIAPKNDASDTAKRFVWYSLKHDKAAPNLIKYQAGIDMMSFYSIWPSTSFFTRGSGEAAGTLLDFFSPSEKWSSDHVDDDGEANISDASPKATVKDLDPMSFPIKDECDDNWVIMITAGYDVPSGQTYTAEQAIRNLYDMTDSSKGNTVTMIDELDADGSIKSLKQGRLNAPIRTIVIGLITKPDEDADAANQKEYKDAVDRLNRMAKAGQPGVSDAQAYIANSAGELRRSIEAALRYIHSDMASDMSRTTRSSLTEGDAMANAAAQENFNIYSTSYAVLNNNQWRGELRRFASVKNEKGELTVELKGRLGNDLRSKRGSRSLKYWSPSESKFVDLTNANTNDDGEFATMTNITRATMGHSSVGTSHAGQWLSDRITPAEAMRLWYQGYDYVHASKEKYDRQYLLSDFGQSAAMVLEPPVLVDSLPGYKAWAETQKDLAPMLYAQTNDGLLHIVDPETMQERTALLPPPVLLPDRMISLKADMPTLAVNYKSWIDIDEPERDLDVSQARRSYAAFLLDGALQRRYFDLNNDGDWGAYIIATLGRAGSGIYMMDATRPSDPDFMWHRETIATETSGSTSKVAVVEWDKDTQDMTSAITAPAAVDWRVTNSDKKSDTTFVGWTQLGFNSPKPALGVVGTEDTSGAGGHQLQNVIVLPGGMKSKLEKSGDLEAYNGTEGAALYVVDPKDGSILRVFNSRSLNDIDHRMATAEPRMGMMVSEPVFYRTDASPYIASRAFAADNLGRIFMVDFGRTETSGGVTTRTDSKDPDDWSIELVASVQERAEAVTGNYAVPSGVAFSKLRGGNIWMAGGTANVGTRNSDGTDSARLINEKQLLFSFNIGSDLRSITPQYRSSWKQLDIEANDSTLGPSDADKRGWYIELAKKDATFDPEYVTAKPVIVDGKLFAASFKAKLHSTTDASRCQLEELSGLSRLYAVDLATGAPTLWSGDKAKYREFGGIKITGLTLSQTGGRKTLIVTYDVINNVDANSGTNGVDSVVNGDDKMSKVQGDEINAFTIDLGETSAKQFKDGMSVIDYWMEK